ncbi:hypothetical protein BMS3Bbin15_00014 [archaeon BMS3Bbin15]|nr:hypothetical protein BMS3Bbin15_00014 [archaeon BMS3Bbin15]
MGIKHIVFAIILIFLTSGCYAWMTGIVVDAETGKPIDGAVVLVEWTYTSGKWMGLRSTSSYKVVERVTDKEGKFTVSGVFNPLVNPPTVVVYKKGYVAWRSDFIFPDYRKREEFQWKNNYMFKLERFKKIYSHSRHISFLSSSGLSLSSTKLEHAHSWEIPYAREEERLVRKKRNTQKKGEYTEKEIWREVVEELYFQKGEDISE